MQNEQHAAQVADALYQEVEEWLDHLRYEGVPPLGQVLARIAVEHVRVVRDGTPVVAGSVCGDAVHHIPDERSPALLRGVRPGDAASPHLLEAHIEALEVKARLLECGFGEDRQQRWLASNRVDGESHLMRCAAVVHRGEPLEQAANLALKVSLVRHRKSPFGVHLSPSSMIRPGVCKPAPASMSPSGSLCQGGHDAMVGQSHPRTRSTEPGCLQCIAG